MKPRIHALLTLAVVVSMVAPAAPSVYARIAAPPATPAGAPLLSHVPPAIDRAAILESFGRMPLYFVENQGQVDPRVAYYVQGSDKTIYFTPEGVTFALTAPVPGPAEDSAQPDGRLRFGGPRQLAEPPDLSRAPERRSR